MPSKMVALTRPLSDFAKSGDLAVRWLTEPWARRSERLELTRNLAVDGADRLA